MSKMTKFSCLLEWVFIKERLQRLVPFFIDDSNVFSWFLQENMIFDDNFFQQQIHDPAGGKQVQLYHYGPFAQRIHADSGQRRYCFCSESNFIEFFFFNLKFFLLFPYLINFFFFILYLFMWWIIFIEFIEWLKKKLTSCFIYLFIYLMNYLN